MRIKYFSTAWNDVRHSSGWFGKVLLLGLVACIPVFGWIVVLGYLYGWARDIAWGVHAPLPARIFGNEDGKLYSRGFFALVITFVSLLVPGVIRLVGMVVGGGSSLVWGHMMHGARFLMTGTTGMGFLIGLVALVAVFFAVPFSWVGSMRMSIYGRLSAGFQLGKIWAMTRRDSRGLARIALMAALLLAALCVVFLVLAMGVMIVSTLAGFLAAGGNGDLVALRSSGGMLGVVVATGITSVVLSLCAGYVGMTAAVLVVALVTRAMGHWMRQFDVPAWRGQDDPMPFEEAYARSAQR